MDFSSKDPAVIAGYIRFWLGGLDLSVISDETLLFIIDIILNKDTTYTGCDVIYYSTLEVLRWLARKQEQGLSSGGELRKKSEKVGDVQVSYEYDTGLVVESATGWKGILEDLLQDPSSIGCPITTVETDTYSTVHFGGVSQSEYDKVRDNTDSRNGWSYSSPFRQTLGSIKLKG